MYNRCQVPRLTTMLDDKEEKGPGPSLEEEMVDKDFKLKRKRTGAKNSGSGYSNKRPRVLSVTPCDAQMVTVSGDQVPGSSTNTLPNEKHFPVSTSLRVSNHKDEAKFKPKTTAGATNVKSTNGNNSSITQFFKPVLGRAPVAENFYPPD